MTFSYLSPELVLFHRKVKKIKFNFYLKKIIVLERNKLAEIFRNVKFSSANKIVTLVFSYAKKKIKMKVVCLTFFIISEIWIFTVYHKIIFKRQNFNLEFCKKITVYRMRNKIIINK